MRTITVVNQLSLDGVMQAPARPDEDERGGFARGGWAVPYGDDVLAAKMGGRMGGEGALLLGRRTYEDLFAAWHGRTDNPFTAVLDGSTKYVASRTLADPLPWENSVLLPGDATEAAAALDGRLTIIGSGELVRALLAVGLVDELVLIVNPLVLGSGRRMFADRAPELALALVEATPTTTGALVLHYRRG